MLKKKKRRRRGRFLREKVPIWCVAAAEERAGVSGALCSSTNCPEERMLLGSLTPARFKALSAKVNTIISPSWETSQDIWEEVTAVGEAIHLFCSIHPVSSTFSSSFPCSVVTLHTKTSPGTEISRAGSRQNSPKSCVPALLHSIYLEQQTSKSPTEPLQVPPGREARDGISSN